MKLRLTGLALLCSAAAHVHADPEHDRIVSDRAAANARLADQVRECGTRFVVAPCLEEARKENRATLAELRQQEIKLDESRRRAVAEARRKAIAEKAEAQQNRASDASADAPRVRVRREPPAPPSAPISATPDAPSVDAPAVHAPSAAIDRPSLEQRSQARFEARAREAKAHRDAVARRNAQRAAQGKVVAPLPVPPGASVPR